MRRQWRCVDKNNHYYFQTHDGRIIGQVYNLAYTIVWGAKIPVNATEELIIGQYIEQEYAKKAIEEYWDGKDRTFDVHYERDKLLTTNPQDQ